MKKKKMFKHISRLKGIGMLLAGCLAYLCACSDPAPKPVNSTQVQKETFLFSVQGTDSLFLDKYELPALAEGEKRPVMIFAFGGGFVGGDRADESYVPYFEFLARNGFVVVSTDYRTTLKGSQTAQAADPQDFVKAFLNAINTAVADFYEATTFVIKQDSAWNINPQKIAISGSSAGAITVLQAEYTLCNKQNLARLLPADFQYAGVVAFSGAIADIIPPHWDHQPCPILLFHGDADPIVPFRQAAFPNFGGLWGSETIAESLKALDVPFSFYQVANAGHEIASLPMKRNQYDIVSFLQRQVLTGEKVRTRIQESVPGDTAKRKDFTAQDYIQANLR